MKKLLKVALVVCMFTLMVSSVSAAWWNESYTYKRDVEGNDLIAPMQESDIDSDGINETFYLQGGVLYYNSDDDWALADSTETSKICGFQTSPNEHSECNNTPVNQVAYIPMDGTPSGAGGTIPEYVNNKDGTSYGGVTTGVEGKANGAFYFNGDNDYLIFPDMTVTGSQNRIYSFWFQCNSSTRNTVFFQGVSDAGNMFYFQLERWGIARIQIGSARLDYNTYNFTNKQWYHAVIDLNGSTMSDVDLYINGTYIAPSFTGDGGQSINTEIDTNWNTTIGYGNPDANTGYFHGKIDNFQIKNRSLNTDEIYYLYNTSKEPKPNTFGTEVVSNTAPSYANETPKNGSTNIKYSPTLSLNVTDPENDDINVTFYDASDDSIIGTDTNVLSGNLASTTWNGLSPCATYSWYANVSDGNLYTTTETYYFTTNCAPDTPINPEPISGTTNVSLNPTMSAYFNDTDGDDLNITFYEETGPTDFIWCVVSNVPSDSRYSCDQSNLNAGTFYDWYVEVSDGLSTTTSATWNFTTNHYPILENVSILDQSGETSYNFGESLGNITVDAYDKEDGDTNTPTITIIGPEGVVRASDVPMNASTGNTYIYSTSISFDSVGEWTTNISITDSGGLRTDEITNFTVQKTNVSSGGRIYAYDFERLPTFTEVNNSITEYDYFLVEIYVNKSSNWTKTSRLIQKMKNNSYIANLVWEEDLSNIDSSISYVQSHYQDLIDQEHLNGMRHLKIRVDDSVAENTDNSENISQLAKTMFQEVENKFPIYLRDYDHADINTNYITVDPYIYISEGSKKKLINTEMSYLKNSTDKSRIYYNLTAPLQSYTSDWQVNIINKMRAGINITSKYGQSNVAELNNGDIIVANPNATEDSYNISTYGIRTKNAYDLTDHSILDGNAEDSINITLPKQSAHMVYFLNLTKITINNDYFIYGRQPRFVDTVRNLTEGSAAGSFKFVSSTSNPDDGRIMLTDPAYRDPKFYVWYGQNQYSAKGDFSVYDRVIVSDENATWMTDLTSVTTVFQYMAVSDYGNNNEPDGCTPGVDCTSWNRTKWIQEKKAKIDSLCALHPDVNVFIDGLDIANVNDVDGLFGESLIELTDYVKDTKNRKLGLNTYTNYENYANLGDWTMRESACARWDGTASDPTYSYEDISTEIERVNFHRSHGIPVLAQAFGNITDYHKAYYCYMQTKVLYGDLADYSYNQPNFFYTGADDSYTWNYYKYPVLGDQIENDYTKIGDDSYRRRFENGIVTVNTSSRTVDYVNDEIVQSMQFCSYFYDQDDVDEGYMHFVINDNLSKSFDIADTDLSAFTKTWKCVNLSTDNFFKEGFYEIEFYYLDDEGTYTENNGLSMYLEDIPKEDKLSFYDQTLNDHPSNDESDYITYATGKNWAVNFTIERTTTESPIDDITDYITRTETGESVKTITLFTDKHYNIPIYDKEVYLNTTVFNGIFVNGTKLNTTTTDCDTDTPEYASTTINGETWQACYYEGSPGYYVKVVLPGLSTKTYSVNGNLPPNTPTNYSPVNGSTGHKRPVNLSVNVTDPNGDDMNVTFIDGTGAVIGNDTNVDNGSIATVIWSGLNSGENYSWYVNVSDGWNYTVSGVNSFITNYPPYYQNPSPDGVLGGILSQNLTIDVYDEEGYTMNVSYYSTNHYNITNLVENRNYSIVEKDAHDIHWNNNGTKFYIVGADDLSSQIRQHNCSVPYKLNTCEYSGYYYMGYEIDYPYSIDWEPDGTSFIVGGWLEPVNGQYKLWQYECSKPFNIFTANKTNSLNQYSNGATNALEWYDNGNGLIELVDGADEVIANLECSKPYNLSTCDFVQNVSISGPTNVMNEYTGMIWSEKGKEYYLTNLNNVDSYENRRYDCTEAFNVTTCTNTINITSTKKIFGGDWNNEGSVLYTVDRGERSVYEFYNLEGSLFTDTSLANGSTSSYYWTGLDDGSRYSWYANITDGDAENITDVYTFTTDNKPETTNISPANGTRRLLENVSLKFNVIDQDNDLVNVSLYDYETDTLLKNWSDISNGTQLEYNWTGLSRDEKYIWEVQTTDGILNNSEWYVFYTNYIPDLKNIYPADGQTNIPTDLTSTFTVSDQDGDDTNISVRKEFGFCKQETANASHPTDSDCPLLYGGGYSFVDNWYSGTSGNLGGTEYLIDGDYDTYSKVQASETAHLYVNYTVNDTKDYKISFKRRWDNGLNDNIRIINVSLDKSTILNNTIVLDYELSCPGTFCTPVLTIRYYNGSNWTQVYSKEYIDRLYEEAVYLNVDPIVNRTEGVANNTLVSSFWDNLENGRTYQWYAKANDSIDTYDTGYLSFTTNYLPEIGNVSPTNNSREQPRNVTLSFNVSDREENVMNVSIYNETGGLLYNVSGANNTIEYNWTNLDFGTKYGWYVNVSDSIETYTSGVRYFTTEYKPDFKNISPANNSIRVPETEEVTLAFTMIHKDLDKMSFDVYFNGSLEISSIALRDNGSRVERDVGYLKGGKKYPWNFTLRSNDDGYETTSGELNFTMNYAPNATLNAPADNKTEVLDNTTLNITTFDYDGDLHNVTIYNTNGSILKQQDNVSNNTVITYLWDNLVNSTEYGWYANITDGYDEVKTEERTFETNYVPNITDLELRPAPTNITDNITMINYTSDPNGGVFTKWHIEWYENSTLQPSFTNKTTYNLSATRIADEVYARARVFDGVYWSDWEQSHIVTIGDFEAPNVSLYRVPSKVNENQKVTFRVELKENNKMDYVKSQITDPNGIKYNLSMNIADTDNLSYNYTRDFTPGIVGKYRVKFYVRDGSNNKVNSSVYTMTVEKEEPQASGGGGGGDTIIIEEGNRSFTVTPGEETYVARTGATERREIVIENTGDVKLSLIATINEEETDDAIYEYISFNGEKTVDVNVETGGFEGNKAYLQYQAVIDEENLEGNTYDVVIDIGDKDSDATAKYIAHVQVREPIFGDVQSTFDSIMEYELLNNIPLWGLLFGERPDPFAENVTEGEETVVEAKEYPLKIKHITAIFVAIAIIGSVVWIYRR